MSNQDPDNEKKRLKVLWQYDVLDTLPEEMFDDLTELAASICEAPVALISLVDEDRQWFKSKVGTTLSQTARNISFCSHVIQQSGLFIVPDAAADARFAHSPLVTEEPGIRFYAGAPLVTPDGYALGTLCVIDKVPRELSAAQKRALTILSRHVVAQLELRRRSRELAQVRKEAEKNRAELRQLKSQMAAHRKLQQEPQSDRKQTAGRRPPRKSRSAQRGKATTSPWQTRRR